MRPRRTPPALVSMWMLDVFCCALGCVTLLWLLNTREAKQEATRASAALTDLASTRDNLAAAKADAEATRRTLNAQLDDLRGRLVATTNERDETAKLLALAKSEIADQTAKIAAAATRSQEQDDLLAAQAETHRRPRREARRRGGLLRRTGQAPADDGKGTRRGARRKRSSSTNS